jgi:hypothetical protein
MEMSPIRLQCRAAERPELLQVRTSPSQTPELGSHGADVGASQSVSRACDGMPPMAIVRKDPDTGDRMTDEPTPQPRGQRVPPRRRPPVAVAVCTPDPPEKRSLFVRLRAWVRRLGPADAR